MTDLRTNHLEDIDDVRRDMLDDAIEVEAFDAQVGSLLKALEESGELDNTLVIVTSDLLAKSTHWKQTP